MLGVLGVLRVLIAIKGAFVAENIGFIGLGVMGKPMAGHLIKAGHRLTVHNRSRGAVDELVAAGATAAASPAEVARASSIVRPCGASDRCELRSDKRIPQIRKGRC